MRLILPILFLATPALALDCAEGQRVFAHHGGETCIPADPQRIVAVRHDSLATPLIELGAPLVGVLDVTLPLIYPETFPAPLTDDQVAAALAE